VLWRDEYLPKAIMMCPSQDNKGDFNNLNIDGVNDAFTNNGYSGIHYGYRYNSYRSVSYAESPGYSGAPFGRNVLSRADNTWRSLFTNAADYRVTGGVPNPQTTRGTHKRWAHEGGGHVMTQRGNVLFLTSARAGLGSYTWPGQDDCLHYRRAVDTQLSR